MKRSIKISIPPFLIVLAVALAGMIGVVSNAQALSPPPDGGYPGGNTAEGTSALLSLTTGTFNTAAGWFSLESNSAANFNTAVGAGTLVLNTADSNTAVGAAALLLNTTGPDNTAVGANALVHNIAGDSNTALGAEALEFNEGLSSDNTAVGAEALFNNVDGSENTAVGNKTGQNVITGFNNTYVGGFVGTLADDESNTIRIGDVSNGNGAGSLQCYIGGIFNNHQPLGGSVVMVTLNRADDHLGWDTIPSAGGGQALLQVPQRAVPPPRGRLQPAAHAEYQAMLTHKVE